MKKTVNQPYWKEFIPKSFIYINRKNYSWNFFRNDIIAGITVGVVALPLAMAFSIASGLPPGHGLITAIVAGFLISLLGGSRYQIGGPTGAFVVILYKIIQTNGYEGLIFITLLAGIILLIAAFSRIGSLIKYIPYPLIIGFTTGIAVTIFSTQIKDFLGLKIENMPADFISIWTTVFSALPSIHAATFAIGLGTLAIILLLRRFIPQIPWGITSVIIMSLTAWLCHLPIETIETRFGEMKLAFSIPNFHNFPISLAKLYLLLPDAVTIALLAGIESLLSALVADGMTGAKHKSNCELMAQGIANIGSVLCGGITATGAIARTAMTIKTGAKTPLAGMIHSVTLLLIVLFFSPLVSKIPLASLSAVLMMVAWNMSEYQHFRHLFKSEKSDIIVLLATFLITVFINLTAAIEIGMILSVFIFMKRMKDTSGVISLTALDKEYKEGEEKYDVDSIDKKIVPRGVEVFEIAGPFFFGIADTLKNNFLISETNPKIFILRLRKVPFIDASGMHSLMEFHASCKTKGSLLFLSGVSSQLFQSLKKFGIIDLIGEQNIFSHIDLALNKAAETVTVCQKVS